MRMFSNDRGLTIVEFMVTAVVLAVAFAGVAVVLYMQDVVWENDTAFLETGNVANRAVATIQRDLRSAIKDSVSISADGTRLSFRLLEGLDGQTLQLTGAQPEVESGARVRYELVGTTLMRRTTGSGGTAERVIATGVRSATFAMKDQSADIRQQRRDFIISERAYWHAEWAKRTQAYAAVVEEEKLEGGATYSECQRCQDASDAVQQARINYEKREVDSERFDADSGDYVSPADGKALTVTLVSEQQSSGHAPQTFAMNVERIVELRNPGANLSDKTLQAATFTVADLPKRQKRLGGGGGIDIDDDDEDERGVRLIRHRRRLVPTL